MNGGKEGGREGKRVRGSKNELEEERRRKDEDR